VVLSAARGDDGDACVGNMMSSVPENNPMCFHIDFCAFRFFDDLLPHHLSLWLVVPMLHVVLLPPIVVATC
jgi:hypothetical protein